MLPALRTALLKRGPAVTARSGRTVRRGYATAGPEIHTKKSELPWILGSVGFTVPAVFYLLSGTSPEHSHDAHLNSVKDTAHDITKAVKSSIPSTESVKAAATSAAPSISEKVSHAADIVSDKASKTSAAVNDAPSKVAKQAKETTEDASESVKAAVTPEPSTQRKVEDVVTSTKESANAARDSAKNTLEDITSSAKDGVTPPSHSLADATPEAASSLTSKAKKVAGDVKDKIASHPPPETKYIPKHKGPMTGATGGINDKDAAPGDVVGMRVGTAATDRDPRSFNEMSGKQEGLSNGPTFHASLHSERGREISMKAEGVHDTTKLKGTVDPSREGS